MEHPVRRGAARHRLTTHNEEELKANISADGDDAHSHPDSAPSPFVCQLSDSSSRGIIVVFAPKAEVGVRPVGADATLSFKSGRLCSFVYSPKALLSASRYPFREDSRSMTSQLIMIHNGTIVQAQPYNDKNYNITRLDTIMRGREAGTFVGLLVTVTPNATPSEYRHALTFDLSCFTSLQGCRTICQLMPLALQDYVSKLRTRGEPVPEGFKEESESPACLEAYNATR